MVLDRDHGLASLGLGARRPPRPRR
jgi:hypothetical protein